MPDEMFINRDIIYICPDGQEEALRQAVQRGVKLKKNSKVESFIGIVAGEFLPEPFGSIIMGAGQVAATLTDSKFTDIFEDLFAPASPSKSKNKTDGAIQFISVDCAEDRFNHDGIEVKGSSNFSSGMILVKHPFLKNIYVTIDLLETEILHHKLLCLSTIAQYLGAKSISGHAVITEEQKRCRSISGDLTYEVVNANVRGKTENYHKYESEYSLDDAFTGEFTAESYEHAKNKAVDFGLDKDIEIKNLIDQRNPEHSISIASRKLTIELSREYNKVIDTAFSLCIPEIKLGAGYKSILESCKTILFEMDIKF